MLSSLLSAQHGGAADNKQRAFMSALAYRFLHKTLNVAKALAR